MFKTKNTVIFLKKSITLTDVKIPLHDKPSWQDQFYANVFWWEWLRLNLWKNYKNLNYVKVGIDKPLNKSKYKKRVERILMVSVF